MGNCLRRSARCSHHSSSISSDTPKFLSRRSSNSNQEISSASLKRRLTRLKSDPSTSGSVKSFSFNDLKNATKNFRTDNFLGEGGFGSVYKGWIDENIYAPARPGVKTVVAIKKLKRDGPQGHKEWLAEVNYLGQLRHENLVKLVGYCSEFDSRLLVYEFMARGSLENHLFRKEVQPISWAIRMSIAVGVARGLSFLHNLETPVIYRDLKASNILLDSLFNAKLSDFGLARDGPTGDNTHVSTRVIGTQGYAAPEYVATGHLTTKSDVYSFGVVLLELLSGRRALDEDRAGVEENLVEWTKPFLSDNGRVLRIMDTKLWGQYPKKEAQAAAALALQCLDTDPKNRPSMKDVVVTLEELKTSRESPRTPPSNKLENPRVKHASNNQKVVAIANSI